MNWREKRSYLHPYSAVGTLLIASCFTFAQTNPLAYRPVDAGFSASLDRIVLISANPNALHIYDPVSQNDVKVSLAQPPLSLSISPDGLHAAVGHDALISYVNLTTHAIEKQIPVAVKVQKVALSAS